MSINDECNVPAWKSNIDKWNDLYLNDIAVIYISSYIYSIPCAIDDRAWSRQMRGKMYFYIATCTPFTF